jgi:hypothetical protein
MMPVLDGWATALKMRRAEEEHDWLSVPIVAYTSEDVPLGSPMWMRCIESGMNDVVVSTRRGPGSSRRSNLACSGWAGPGGALSRCNPWAGNACSDAARWGSPHTLGLECCASCVLHACGSTAPAHLGCRMKSERGAGQAEAHTTPSLFYRPAGQAHRQVLHLPATVAIRALLGHPSPSPAPLSLQQLHPQPTILPGSLLQWQLPGQQLL